MRPILFFTLAAVGLASITSPARIRAQTSTQIADVKGPTDSLTLEQVTVTGAKLEEELP